MMDESEDHLDDQSDGCIQFMKPTEQLLELLVKEEEQMRFSQEYINKCDEVADETNGWLRITGEMQKDLVAKHCAKHGFTDEMSVDITLNSLRRARYLYPENPIFKTVPVYVRENKANPGTLEIGDPFVDTVLYNRSGEQVKLSDMLDPDKPNIIFSGSHT